jgi:hypothetical protein
MSSHNFERVGWDAMTRPDEFIGKSDLEIMEMQDAYSREMMTWFMTYKTADPPYLTLDDGTAIALEDADSGMMFDYFGGSADYVSEYFDIGQLHSITFCGEEYIFPTLGSAGTTYRR